MRVFIVVAKNRPDLYQYFAAGFEGVADVSVILDRRLGPDDPAPQSSDTPTHHDRRVPRDVYDELAQRGFVIVRLPA